MVSALLALCESPMMPMMAGKTNVRPVDGPAVTDRDKRYAEYENDMTEKWTVLA